MLGSQVLSSHYIFVVVAGVWDSIVHVLWIGKQRVMDPPETGVRNVPEGPESSEIQKVWDSQGLASFG